MYQLPISAAIIAGGASKRFGKDKTLAIYKGKPLIEWATDGVNTFSNDSFIIAKDISKFSFLPNIKIIPDLYDVQCPLVGLLTAFKSAKHNTIFMISADMPAFNYSIVAEMFKNIGDYDVVAPVINGRIFPCSALYSKKNEQFFYEMYKNGDYKLKNALDKLNVLYLDEDFFSKFDKTVLGFTNINKQEDLDTLIQNTVKLHNP